jgi:hypothetical protein
MRHYPAIADAGERAMARAWSGYWKSRMIIPP